MDRTNVFASLRFLMIFYIVQGHFLQVATTDKFWLALFKQHNAVVGCFFLLSGFLLTFAHKPGQTIAPWWAFVKKRIVRIYPVYAVVLILFLPMFLTVDFHYGARITDEFTRALVAGLLLQAWHPEWGLLWNSPTWFLSSLVFCYACFPLIMMRVKDLGRKKLWVLIGAIFGILLSIKIAYSLENGFFFLEGLVEPKPIAYFNVMRFFPPINLLEFILGMLVGLQIKHADTSSSKRISFMPVGLLLSIVAILFIRVHVPLNDMLTRTLVLTPLFLTFLYNVSLGQARFLDVFESKLWIFLGEISFSLYVIHGALGQLFYKKAVKAMWAIPEVPYGIYLALLFALATPLYYGVERRWAGMNARRDFARAATATINR